MSSGRKAGQPNYVAGRRNALALALQHLDLSQLPDDLLGSESLVRHRLFPFQTIFSHFAWFRKYRSGQPLDLSDRHPLAEMPPSDNGQKCHVDHFMNPPVKMPRGRVQHWSILSENVCPPGSTLSADQHTRCCTI